MMKAPKYFLKKSFVLLVSVLFASSFATAKSETVKTQDSAFVTTMKTQLNRKYETYLKKAQRPRFAKKAEQYHLTDEELVAIYSYTVDLYRPLNKALREGGEKAKLVAPFVTTLESGLAKLPAAPGEFVRSTELPTKVRETYKEGAVVSDPAFMSAGMNLNTSAADQIKVTSKTGRLVVAFSSRAEEGEIVFPPNTKFKVVKVAKAPDGKNQYAIEEVAP